MHLYCICKSLEPQVPFSIEWLPYFPKIHLQPVPRKLQGIASERQSTEPLPIGVKKEEVLPGCVNHPITTKIVPRLGTPI